MVNMSQQRLAARSQAVHAPRRRNKPVKWLGGLASFEDLPVGLQDNNYIRRGYRLGYSWRDTLISVFTWHNESGNIHTHLWGFAFFLVLTVLACWAAPSPFHLGSSAASQLESHLAQLRASAASNASDVDLMQRLGSTKLAHWESQLSEALAGGRDSLVDLPPRAWKVVAALLGVQWPAARWPLFVFLAGAMLCLLTSATCHLLSCCSVEVNAVIWAWDYAGIAVLTVASFAPPVYYGFLDYPRVQMFYLVSTFLFGVVCTAVTLLPSFQSPHFRPLRAALFVGLGLWGVVPAVHGWRLHAHVPAVNAAIRLDVLMGAIYLVGAAVYALRVPERFKPGRFDYLFNSHQLFHIAVVVAAFVHYQSVMILVKWRDISAAGVAAESLSIEFPEYSFVQR